MKTPMILIAACAMWLAGCTMQATYRHAPTTGRFSGEPRMVAIAPNTFFFFQPNKDTPFTFTTLAGEGREGEVSLGQLDNPARGNDHEWGQCSAPDLVSAGFRRI